MKHFIYTVVLCLLSLPLFARSDNFHNNVLVNRGGNVLIDGIPQVSQRRNYCVPASVSMIVRYFDKRINQKKLAKLFETSSKKGTFTAKMAEAFFNEPVLSNFELVNLYTLTEKEYSALMELYKSSVSEKRAKRKGKEDNEMERNVFDDIKPKEARKLFPSARTELNSIFRSVYTEYICSGIPVLWAVSMNLDPAVSMKGGHMRIIVGFNVQNKKIKRVLYRDPWGSVKTKQVDLDDAVTMTMEMYAVVPKSYTQRYRCKFAPELK